MMRISALPILHLEPKSTSPWLENEDRHGLDKLVYSKLIALWKPDPLVEPTGVLYYTR